MEFLLVRLRIICRFCTNFSCISCKMSLRCIGEAAIIKKNFVLRTVDRSSEVSENFV